MKRSLLTTLLIMAIGVWSVAQITINHTDMPILNDTLRYSITIPAIDPGFTITGENFSWDFSGLDFQIQEREDYKALTSINPWVLILGGFSNDGLGLKSATNLPLDEFDVGVNEFYSVYHNSAERFIIEGFFINTSPIPLPLKYSQPDVVYSFPLNFGNSDSISFSGFRALGDTLSLTREGYRKNEVDGWGMIKTPLGEFDALRVKTTLYESDSLFWTSLEEPIVVRRTNIFYIWLAKEQKIPVMEARYLVLDDDPENLVLLAVRYKDIYREPIIEKPVADFHADKTEAIIDEPIQLLNNSTPDHETNSYLWTFLPDDTVVFLNETNDQSPEPVVLLKSVGNYTVKLVAENTSGKDSLTRENYLIIKDQDPTAADKVNVPLQPEVTIKNNHIFINHPRAIEDLFIYDISGRQIFSLEGIRNSTLSFYTQEFTSGTYIFSISETDNKNSPVHVKVIVP
jgi:hypothetical protein